MINFFRKTRKKLADDNKFFKYWRYALGEIVLVVIGILLALQLNIWNEKRQVSKIENRTLKDLNKEFEKNQQLLETNMIETDKGIKAMDVLLEHMSPELTNVKIDTIDELLASFIYIPKYNPIKDVYNSDNKNLIENIELQYKLTNWNRDLDTYNYWITILGTIVTEHCLPFMYKNYNTANYGVPEIYKPLQRSKFEFSQMNLLGSSHFENLVAQRRLLTIQLKLTSIALQNSQEEINKLISEELKK